MQLISVGFFIFWLLTLAIYYIFSKYQWQVLLLASLCFYMWNAKVFPFMLLISAIFIWTMGKIKSEEIRRFVLIGVIFFDISVLAFYKFYTGELFFTIKSHVPIGISFFILTSLGYCLDVHWERIRPEQNLCKLMLFLAFFPALLQGPIIRYEKMKNEFFRNHKFSMYMICKGLQRFLWGLFKKLIIAERLSGITNNIFSDIDSYSISLYSVGVICYAIQLYADFSGYMDLVIGIAQTFDIKLPENFRRPYFSKSVAEFWRRWHITLGIWFKDYLMYAFIMSSAIKKFGKRLRRRNKKLGKLVPVVIGTMLVWVLTGLWHGNSFGYMLWGLYYGSVMCSTLCLEDFYKKIKNRSGFAKNKLYDVFCIFRTLVIVFIADTFICAGSWKHIKICIKKVMEGDFYDPTLLGQFKMLAGSNQNIVLLIIGCMILFTVSFVEERRGDIWSLIEKRNIVIRWAIWYALIFAIFLFGAYGTGYDTSAFMYQIY